MALTDQSHARVASDGGVKNIWAYTLLAFLPVGFALGALSASQPALALIYVAGYVVIALLDSKAIARAGRSIGLLAPLLGFWLPPVYFFMRARVVGRGYVLFGLSIVLMLMPLIALSVLSTY